MLALPKKWAQEMGLKQGDKVSIAKHGSRSLVVMAKDSAAAVSHEKNAEVVIDPLTCRDDVGQVLRRIISYYLRGYTRIDISIAAGARLTSTQRTVIKELVRRCLMGTEIISDSSDGISLQVLLGHAQLNVQDAIKRMFLITASMYNDAAKSIVTRDRNLSDSVIKNDDDVDRFSFFVMRQLEIALRGEVDHTTIGLDDAADLLRYMMVVSSIEKIADLACKLAAEGAKLKEPLDDYIVARIRRLTESAIGFAADSVLALFDGNYATGDRVIRATRLFASEVEKDFALIENNEGAIRPASCLTRVIVILESIKRTAQCASDIAEVVLNISVQNPPQPFSAEKLVLQAR